MKEQPQPAKTGELEKQRALQAKKQMQQTEMKKTDPGMAKKTEKIAKGEDSPKKHGDKLDPHKAQPVKR